MKPGRKPFTTKVCPRCGIEKPRTEYYKKGKTVSHKCIPCSLEDSKSRASRYFGKYTEYQNQWKREQTEKDTAYNLRRKALKKARYEQRKHELNEKRRQEWASNPFCSARKHNRNHDIKQRQPKWANVDAILAFYAACPEGHHVDHIVPLKGLIDGRPVSGLHVPWNLQYLTAHENRKKHCRIKEADLASL